MYNDNPRDPKIVAVLLTGGRCSEIVLKRFNWDLKIVAVVDRWSLFGGVY